MRRLSSKIIAFILAMCMVLPLVPSAVLAVEDESAVGFSLEKVEETKDTVKLKVTITGGEVLCFDLKVEAVEDLTCSAIVFSDAIKNFNVENSNGTIAANPETGMISFANTSAFAGPADVAIYTFTKSAIKGITADDFDVEVSSCYSKGEDGNDVQLEVSADNNLPETHTHIKSSTVVVLKDSTCAEEGEGVYYCTECGGVAESFVVEKKEHKVTEVRVNPTCEEDGYYRKYCSACDETFEYEFYSKLAHSNAVPQHKDATCTEDGYDRFYCPDCGEYLDETVYPATNHANKVHEHKDATCTEDGYDRDYCPDCEEYLNETVLPALNHKNKVHEHKEATCTEDGYDRDYCPDCGEYLNVTVIKHEGHKIVTEHKEATCTEDGYHKEYCSKCGEVFKDETYTKTGHQHTSKVITDATCTEDGSIKEICDDCGTVIKVTVIAHTGHKLVNDVKNATCIEDGYIDRKCTKCGYVDSHMVLKHTGHSWTDWQVVKEPTYSTVGLERKVCRYCGESHEREIPMVVVPVQKIVITPSEDFTMNVKKKDKLQADVYPEEAAYSAEIIFESSDPSIVSVDEEGNITAKRRGTATITAKTADGKVSDSINVTVEYSTIQWIIIYILFGWIWYL